jgi:hypothetical protein
VGLKIRADTSVNPCIMRTVIIALALLYSFAFSEKPMNGRDMDRICFGRTGGFTNMTIEYVLFENGKLCKMDNGKLVRIGRIKKEQADEIKCSLTCNGFRDLAINEPGNMTYFIRFISSEYQNEVKWSDNDRYPQLRALYDSLMETVKEKQ